jgi:hypothetical protein
MAEDKIYFNSLRGKKGQYSIKVSVNVEKFIEELKANQNEKGYVNLELKERKEADKFGNNVYAVLDTWKPTQSNAPAQSPAQATSTSLEPAFSDDLPF